MCTELHGMYLLQGPYITRPDPLLWPTGGVLCSSSKQQQRYYDSGLVIGPVRASGTGSQASQAVKPAQEY